MSGGRHEWPDHELLKLRRLWDAGYVTREIARRLGRTPSSVIGKSHRLGLPPRPSPIKRAAGYVPVPRKPRVRPLRAGAATLPPLASTASQISVLPPEARGPSRAAAPKPPAGTPRPVVERKAPARQDGDPTRGTCQYPIGGRPMRFCGEPCRPKSPYCQHHHELCRIPVRDRREDREGLAA